jgi:pimeloyl-ACP methyl ester carboxylesterase
MRTDAHRESIESQSRGCYTEQIETAHAHPAWAVLFLERMEQKEVTMVPEQTGQIATLNGTQIYFEVHGAGDPLLLLHGFSGSSQDWTATIAEWSTQFQLIVPDLRGHGRSGILSDPFRHRDAAHDLLALLDRLKITSCKGVGISGGGNVLLHLGTMQPERVAAMVLVSATPYFPAQARSIMRRYRTSISAEQWDVLRRRHPGGDAQIHALLASTEAFAESYDDMNFTPPHLATIRARTLIVQGDRDPLYPIKLSLEMAQAIPHSSLWIVPNAGHGPVIGEGWPAFLKTAAQFLQK